MHPGLPPDSAPLEIDRVEWLPASAGAVHVHLLGRWVDRPVAEPLVLLVGTERGRRSFEALSAAPAGVLAAFAVPNELRPRLTEDVALQIGAHEVALPAAAPGDSDRSPAPGEAEGEVIDRVVLVERRARRAEQAEEVLTARAAEAERMARTLEAQLGNLEEQLGLAREERDGLQAALTDAETRLRAAQQREYAEQERRIEAQDAADGLRGGQEGEIGELRRRVDTANRRAEDMAREVDGARRELAALRHVEDELARRTELQDRIVAQLAAVREELERVREQAGELTALRAQLIERDQDLEQARLALARAEVEAGRLRAIAADHELALRQADRAIEVVRTATAELQEHLDEARREHARTELALREELARSGSAGGRSLPDVERELRAALEHEREAYAGQVAAVQEHVAGLRTQVSGAADQLRVTVEHERAARLAAERAVEAERAHATAERAAAADALARLAAEQTRREELEARLAQQEAEQPGDLPVAPDTMIDDLTHAAERLREECPPRAEEEADEAKVLHPRLLAGADADPRPWLAEAVASLDAEAPALAARLVEAVLPVQGLRSPDPLSYDLTIAGATTFRVTLGDGPATVASRPVPPRPGEIAFRLTGTATQLAALVAGGASRRRPRGTDLDGSRRALRRLLKAQQRPVTLAEVQRSGAAADPELVLRALAACVRPDWTGEHRFTVTFALTGPEPGSWTVAVGPDGAEVLAEAPAGGATATVTLAPQTLLPLLGGFPAPDGSAAQASGNVHVIGLLRRWFDQAQGLSSSWPVAARK